MIWSLSARSLHNSNGNNELCTAFDSITLCTLCSSIPRCATRQNNARVPERVFEYCSIECIFPFYNCLVTDALARLNSVDCIHAARVENTFWHSIDGYRLCDECKIFRMNRLSHWFTNCMIQMVQGSSDAKCRIMPLCKCIVNEPETVGSYTQRLYCSMFTYLIGNCMCALCCTTTRVQLDASLLILFIYLWEPKLCPSPRFVRVWFQSDTREFSENVNQIVQIILENERKSRWAVNTCLCLSIEMMAWSWNSAINRKTFL